MNSFPFVWYPEFCGMPWAEVEGHCTVITNREGDPDALEIQIGECGGDRTAGAEGFVLIHELRAFLWQHYRDRIDACARDDHSGRVAYDRELARAS